MKASFIILFVFVIAFLAFAVYDEYAYQRGWHTDRKDDPSKNGKYIIRFDTGRLMIVIFKDGHWIDEDGYVIPRYQIDRWRDA